MLYTLRGLRKTYDRRTVLALDHLVIPRGKVLGLMGPNGAGKTTLLEILAFLSLPTEGEIWFGEEKVSFSSGKMTNLRRRVVLVQQQPILFTTTVSKNVAFPLRIRKHERVARAGIIDELLDLVGMLPFRDARANRLSGGETQRVAIAQALACFPEVILMDEPTANVDPENQIAIERIIRNINEEKGISVIFTSHDRIQASRLADEIVFLFEGKLASSPYENIFAAHVETDQNGRKFCVIQGGLKLAVNTGRAGPVRVSVDSAAVEILGNGEKQGIDNVMKGKVLQLSDEDSRVRVLVDVGVPLNILVDKPTFREHQASVGDHVFIGCSYKAIKII
jgi:tungstate transport system ATP-binding protein